MLTAVVTAVIFLVMISIHEFGHFFVAKLSGIKVNEYAIGMGPAIFKKQRGETLYSIRLLPIGGFCSMEGEDGESDSDRAFCNQKLWKRFLVVVAGAVLNVLLGFIIFVIISAQNAPFATNTIESLDERSYMYQAGVMAGDKIVNINGRAISFYKDITLYKTEINSAEEVEMTVKRDGKKLKFNFPLSELTGTRIYTESGMTETTTMNGITETKEYAYAEGAEIPPEIIGKEYPVSSLMLGFSPKLDELSFVSLIKEAYYNTVFVVKLVYKSLWDLVSGKAGIEQVSGPVGIVDAVNTAVHSQVMPWLNVLSLAALLTINLGVFNLLPLPALDGGRILFMLFELVRGKPVPPEKEGMIHAIGLILLLLFAALISAKDIMMLIK
ncbi:MAG: site-2 protease family protein [Clostridia bacterium]|nr:site-2 protease family protein [Clostridia bacterium]MBQ8637505.1 site-2 protease family protein [Clostridia bacterium]